MSAGGYTYQRGLPALTSEVSGVLGRLKSPPSLAARRRSSKTGEAPSGGWPDQCGRSGLLSAVDGVGGGAAAEEERRCRLQSAAGYHLGQST